MISLGGDAVMKRAILAFGGAVKDKATTPQKIKALTKFGADVNAKNEIGKTALMCAAQSKHNAEAVIPVLLEAGADIFAKDNKGKTVLDYAKADKVKDIMLNADQ